MSNILEQRTKEIFRRTLAPLDSFLTDPSITEVMVNGPNDVWVERHGRMEKCEVLIDEPTLRASILAAARISGKDAKETSVQALVAADIEQWRIQGVLAPTAADGHALCIRKHTNSERTLEQYEESGAFNRPAELHDPADRNRRPGETRPQYLRRLVHQGCNILVAGATGSGKTTFVNALLREIPRDQRVITIEDTMELKVSVPNRVRLRANKDIGITTRELLKVVLRMKPHRVIVGEVRGEEAFDLLQTLNTGHGGGIATLHANDPAMALTRLEGMAMQGVPPGGNWPLEAIRMTQIVPCIHVLFQWRQVDGRRVLHEAASLEGHRDGRYVLKPLDMRAGTPAGEPE